MTSKPYILSPRLKADLRRLFFHRSLGRKQDAWPSACGDPLWTRPQTENTSTHRVCDRDSLKTAVKCLTTSKELCRSQTALGPYSGPGLGTQKWIGSSLAVGIKSGKGERLMLWSS
ncbi:hypothetical protein MUG91_G137n42 [Manis pentadactyla]|nr:hypothetical protein MUG91_G137n42 [Manis pentadactyla]